jgi:hypothetical protein
MVEVFMKAFWSYHWGLGYFISGTIVKKYTDNDQNYVEIKEYGPSYKIIPSFILSNKKGKKLQKEIDKTLLEFREKENELRIKYQNKINDLTKDLLND